MNPLTAPATCELCGNWLPGHSASCPRNGVHPSQWKDSQFHQTVEEQWISMDWTDNDEHWDIDCPDAQFDINAD
ncbi:hypothetical protein FB192DRAFT_1276504 [Mucor lusitanicus]|uniref:Uncharacterized protein n=2 Tax=Mucor circinelloides f. lusitanicus TaxID=29924 RepID=A0A162MT27_MUCCL|nr:hypothetical protein FB192DRAFT_1276504 [Mucor lusitanicus]OAD05115.1 hypothetical protein MUCCIDRAFT_108961 [Mucor lusitanicus CBS 277.49]